MSPLLLGRCSCSLLSTRSPSKEEESEGDVRVGKGLGLPATPPFSNFLPHPPFGMKLLKVPSTGCPWGVVLFLHRGGRLYWASEVWSATAILEAQDAGVSGLVAGSLIQWWLKLPEGSSGLRTGHSHRAPLSGRRRQRFSQEHWSCSLGLPRQSLSLRSLWPGMDSPSNFWSHIWKIWDNLSCVMSGQLGQSLQMWPGNWGEREKTPFLSPGTSALWRSPRKSKQWFRYHSLKWRAWNSIAVTCKA